MSSEARFHPAVAMIGSALAIAACLIVETPGARTVVLAATLAACAALEWQRSRNVLSPMIVLVGVFAWLYVAKPLYVFDLGLISAGTRLDAIVVAGVWELALAQALAAVTITFCVVFVAFQVVVAQAAPVRRARSLTLNGERYRVAVVAVMPLDVLAFGILVRSAGGLGAYVDGLATRSESFAGLSFLTLAIVPVNLLLLIGLTARFRGDPGAPSRVLLGVLGFLALGSAFLTGGRASLLTGLVLPLLVVVHYAHRRIGPALAAVMGLAGVLTFVALGALLRDSQFSRAAGQGPVSLVQARLANLHESLVGGVEAIPFDSLVRIMGARQFNDLTWQSGDTYRSILTWPIPRMLWEDKPAGGGNAWFSETYVPRFYGDAKVESSISFIGESYANFGWAGVVLGSALLGTIIGLVHARFSGAADTFALPLYAVLLGFLLPVFRGDAYHNVTSVAFSVAVWFGLRLVLGRTNVTPDTTVLNARRRRARPTSARTEATTGARVTEPLCGVARRRTGVSFDETTTCSSGPPLLEVLRDNDPRKVAELMFAINGFFRSQSVSGQQRYATEISRHILAEMPGVQEIQASDRFGSSRYAQWLDLQLRLPITTRGTTLVSLTSRAPALMASQVVTIHDLFPITNPEWFNPRYAALHQRLLRHHLQHAAGIVVVSEPVRRQVVELAKPGIPVVVAPNARTPSLSMGNDGVERIMFPASYFLAVGSVEPRKNLRRLVEAYGHLPASVRRESPLLIVGGGAASFRGVGELRDIACDEVQFLGRVSDQELAGLYSGARVFVSLSLAEGFGLPVVEAASSMTGSMVLSDIPVYRWLIGAAQPVYVDPMSVDDITEGLRRAVDETPDPRLRDIGRQFSWSESAATVAALADRV